MDELIVRVVRALACLTRLQILSHLAHEKEVPPTVLARQLRLGVDTVCVHLRRLTDAGLIVRRRSGALCYAVGRSPYRDDVLSGKISRWLRGLLADPLGTAKDCGLEQVRNLPSADLPAHIHLFLPNALTAFTNVRRVQILRHLASVKEAAAETLMKEMRMSDAAVSRHMSNLVRRGYVRAKRQGHRRVYALERDAKSSLHRRLYALLASTWADERLRS